MSKFFSILSIALLVLTASLKAQTPDSVKVFVDSALNLMEHNSVFTQKVNWKQVRNTVQQMTANARTYKEVYPALRYAFNQLGDKHGWLVLDGEEYRNPSFPPDTNRLNADIKDVISKGPRLYNRTIDNNYAYISIPFFGGQSPAECRVYAQRIQDSLCKNISPTTKGIIIDLRMNAGGNIYPMIAGIANVLGEGLFNIGLDGAGKETSRSAIQQGALAWYDSIPLKPARTCGDLSKLPVTVIIGPVTGSAGECIAIAFRGRPHTKLVGENTGGYVTANDGRLLPGKDNGMVLAMNYTKDRTGKAYYDCVAPDIKVVGGDHFFEPASDEKIQAAVKWLKKQR